MVEFNATLVVAAIAAFFTALGILGTQFYGRLKNKREERKASIEERQAQRQDKNADVQTALDLKDEIIASLKEQNTHIEKQLTEALAREKRLQKEVSDLRRRVAAIEKDNNAVLQKVLESFADSDRCEVANCHDRLVPGERRLHEVAVQEGLEELKPGGTDAE